MPVLEHETHEKVKQKEGFRYGCYNRLRNGSMGYYVPERDITLSGVKYVATYVENTMSRDCRFDMSLTDQACEGCEWQGMGEKYAEEIRRNGK